MNSNSTPVSVTSDEVDNFRRSLLQLQTPSAIERVVDWMGINDNSLSFKDSETKNLDNLGTFYRCDYKSNNTDTQVNIDDTNLTSVFNKSVPLWESPNSIDSKSTHDTLENSNQDILKPRNEFVNSYQSKKNNYHFVPPPSVESKKKELCSYLKLMNRGYKKEVFSSRCRRSTRVQNLEKKKKIYSNHRCNDEVCSEKSTKTNKSRLSDKVESIALQSFEDLNMIVDVSKYPSLQEDIDKKRFNFIMPPETVLKEFVDFKNWIEPFVDDQNNQNGSFDKNHISNSNNHDSTVITDNNEKIEISEITQIGKRKREFDKFRKKIKKRVISSEDTHNNSKKDESNDKMGQQIVYSKTNKKIHDSMSITKNSNNCIVLLHNEILVHRDEEDFKENLANIEEKQNIDDSESEETENIKIRIDYESTHLNDEEMKYHNTSSSGNSIMSYQTLYFKGFQREDREKSELMLSYFNFSTNCIHCVPDNKENRNYICRIYLKENEKNGICSTENQINRNDINIKDTIEIRSKSDSTSDAYSSAESEDSSTSDSTSISTPNCEIISPSQITKRLLEVKPFCERSDIQSLHNLLNRPVKKVSSSIVLNSVHDWDSDNSMNGKQKFESSKNNSHFISFNKENGSILNAVYVDFHLILIQEFSVSMWNQTALGNVLGAQNLWIFNGDTKKLILNKECIRKKSLEMTVSTDDCVAYFELWTKEHKSDFRQGPVADIFVIVYFWLQKSNKIDKKVHQLENIKGFSDDVQYVVLKPSLNIIVSWHSVIQDVKITQVHVYTLASDFQKIVNVRAMSRVEHYVSSLHNIEDCEELLMGCGENAITLWNIEHGYIVSTIKLNDIKLSLSTLWAKCDRGILFILQQCVDKELRLIAINGRSQSWKKLKSYKPPEGLERIQNVYIENGVLISFYEEGVVCWKAQTTEQIMEENHETDMKYFSSGKYVIMTTEKTAFIRHALTHLLTAD
ncbi:putative histone-lysine N-methyltransferase 1 [Harmonia axyridis]|uniref:putative histone-lysine N-methyltransferase 1 n=1 Tax=Harmonia axyridis TaxID=115357 RepID=UPI001E27818D|nr:putative histone-lysine N-methyltransferase 1 [Harmonia axyridis]